MGTGWANVTAGVVFVWLSGCSAAPAPFNSGPCVLAAEQPMLVAELFFGRAIKGRAPLSEGEWAEFTARIVTPNFPEGFTVSDGDGQWRNPRTGQIAHEQTKILLVATRETSDVAQRLSAVIDGYKTQFHQQSVGLISSEACAVF